MHRYLLKYTLSGGNSAPSTEFDAEDFDHALVKAHEVASTWPSEVWEDGERVCLIQRRSVDKGEFWLVAG